MHRRKKERQLRPFLRNPPSHGRPPGLKGKEIGLYYKNLSMQKNKQKSEKEEMINLEIPQRVVHDIYKCLEKIERIAEAKNIYLPPVKKLEFVVTPSPDFIPIKLPDSDRQEHIITNIHKMDNDVIYVKNEEPDVIEILDTNYDVKKEIKAETCKSISEDTAITNIHKMDNDVIYVKNEEPDVIEIFDTNNEDVKKEIKVESNKSISEETANIHKMDIDVIYVKNEEPDVIEILDTSYEDVKKETKVETYKSTSEDTKIFVSNNYTNTPSTSASSSRMSNAQTSKEYKYSYDDIITGTFQEKLEECIAQGIEITKTDRETDILNQALKENHQHMLASNEQYKKMLNFRTTLPTFKKGADLLDVINKNQVVVVSGETGCGKSTQVPQLILDEAIANGRGGNIKVLVTEPRRIAASSLAARVADERGERLGNSVGYAVRLEGISCRDRGSIMFCTTGVMLVELEQNQALSGYSHIILDEVHERDCHIDLAMCLLKQILRKRKDLKLILMSATIDADSLSKYYDNCPMLHIEGLAYPVKDVYLEEILELTKFELPPKPNFLHQAKPWQKYANKHKYAVSDVEKDIQHRANIASWLQPLKETLHPNVINQLQDSRIEELNLNLIVLLLKHICRGDPGAILVFLPGISEITKLITEMSKSRCFPNSTHQIYALHSKLNTIEQKRIFQKPPDNQRKIIVATNIAETSITIDDVVYVVDCGKMKYKGLNVEKNLATLQAEWISKANLRQRRGRAGRCQPGICYHLITTHRAENLPDRLLPELQRSNLLEEVLCVKKLRLGKAEEALNLMPAVPAQKTIQRAIRHLQQVGALDENETLTPLGWHLARLPVHPAAGKLLVLGSLFGCLNRAASLAAVWGFKDPFQMVLHKGAAMDEAKHNFALGEPSDHVAISEAIIQWENCDDYQKRSFAFDNFLSNSSLALISSMKKQFAENLKQMGFLGQANVESKWENRNQGNLSLFKALVAAALYPNIATVRWHNHIHFSPNKPMRINAKTPEDGRVAIHPSSVMATKPRAGRRAPICLSPGANWLVYWLKQKSTDLFLLDVTCVYTLPLLFFGDLNFTAANNMHECFISISSLKVCCKKETAQLLFRLRSLLDQVLTSKISHLSSEQSRKNFEFDHEVLSAVTDLITAEDEGTQYLGDDDDDEDDDSFEDNRSWRR